MSISTSQQTRFPTVAETALHRCPALEIILIEAVLDGDDGEARHQVLVHAQQLRRGHHLLRTRLALLPRLLHQVVLAVLRVVEFAGRHVHADVDLLVVSARVDGLADQLQRRVQASY